MKKAKLLLAIISLGITMAFMPRQADAQKIINNGSDIYVSSGTTLTFAANFENLGDGIIMNNGNVDVMGNWTNNGTNGVNSPGYSGFVNFKSNGPHTISGSTTTKFNKLQIEEYVKMYSDITIWDELNLTGGKINIKNNDLDYQGWTGINATPDYYVIAEETGELKMFVDMMTPAVFPVGTNTAYNPATIAINSASDTYSVNLITDVLENGTSGSTITEIDDCVDITWNINASMPGFTNYNMTVQWDASQEGVGFDRTQSAIGEYHSGQWNANPKQAANGSGPYSLTQNNIAQVGSFAVGDTESPMAITLDLMVDLTALLEGPWDGSEMVTLLRDDNHLPLSQPYNTAPWNYTGTESVSSIPAEIVDWVLIETRDAADAASADGTTILERHAAFVMVDGSIVGLDGSSDLEFTNSATQNLFVVVYHRNHLSVMSATPLTESGGVYSYNFTTSANQAYQNGQTGQKEIATGIWGMYGGDGSGGGNITNFDREEIWQPDAGKTGYLKSDYQMDGQVDNKDKNDVWVGNYMKTSQVPQ